jgi:hypothetical protein
MKKMHYLLVISVAIIISFNSCTKYEQGPTFCILTPEMRITGDWQMEELLIEGNVAENMSFDIVINKDNTGTSTSSYLGFTEDSEFEWKWGDDKTVLLMSDEESEEWEEYQILRLSNNEMWISKDNGILGIWEFRYKKR